MKILFIHPSVELYGADKILLYILELLYDSNDITILLPKQGELVTNIQKISERIKIITIDNLPIVHSKIGIKGALKIPLTLLKINKLFKKGEFDFIYCNTLATVFLLFTNWSKVKIIHIHEIIENRFLNFIFSVLVRINTKNVICVSSHVKDNLLFSTKYKVIHNGIPDLEEYTSSFDFRSSLIKFALPGRYMEKKGQWFLIDALSSIPREKLRNTEFYLYGSAPPNRIELEQNLIEYIKKAKLESIVKMKGFNKNISEIYKNVDVILVPSMMADPFPTTVLESMMFSKPMITTNNGGASEIVDSDFGFLVSPGNTEMLGDAILYFIDNKEKIEDMGNKAREKYNQFFTLNAFKKRFFTLLSEYTNCYLS